MRTIEQLIKEANGELSSHTEVESALIKQALCESSDPQLVNKLAKQFPLEWDEVNRVPDYRVDPAPIASRPVESAAGNRDTELWIDRTINL